MFCTGPGEKWTKPEVVRIANVSWAVVAENLCTGEVIHEVQGFPYIRIYDSEPLLPGLWALKRERAAAAPALPQEVWLPLQLG